MIKKTEINVKSPSCALASHDQIRLWRPGKDMDGADDQELLHVQYLNDHRQLCQFDTDCGWGIMSFIDENFVDIAANCHSKATKKTITVNSAILWCLASIIF